MEVRGTEPIHARQASIRTSTSAHDELPERPVQGGVRRAGCCFLWNAFTEVRREAHRSHPTRRVESALVTSVRYAWASAMSGVCCAFGLRRRPGRALVGSSASPRWRARYSGS